MNKSDASDGPRRAGIPAGNRSLSSGISAERDVRVPSMIQNLKQARHLVAVALFIFAWRFLSIWYSYQHPADYFYFVLFFMGGFIFGPAPWIGEAFRQMPAKRIWRVLPLLFFLLPWGEWIHENFPAARENWSEEILFQICVLYGFAMVFEFFPHILILIHRYAVRFLDAFDSQPRLLWIFPCFFLCFSAWMSLFVYKSIPLIADSSGHLFQAKIFSHFRLWAPAPPVPEFFSTEGDMLVMKDGRWFSMYLPGFAAMLAVAMIFGGQYLLCPLLGAFTVAIWITYARRWHGNRSAAVLGLLCVFSPFLELMSSTVMVHAPELFLASAALYLCRREVESPSALRCIFLGLVMMMAILTRGFSILPFLTPVLAYTCWKRIKLKPFSLALALIIGFLTGIVLVGAFQAQTTGDAFLPGYNLEYAHPHSYGFGVNAAGQRHTPARGLENTSNHILGLNAWLTGWHSGALFFVFLFLLFVEQYSIWDRLLISSCAVLVCFYFFYPFQDLLMGPRFLYPLAPILLLFIARSTEIQKTEQYVLPLMAISLVAFLLMRVPGYVDKYDPSAKQAGQLRKQMEAHRNENLVVFIDRHITPQFLNWNDPFLQEPIILCKDLGDKNGVALKAFPGRRAAYFRFSSEMNHATLKSGFSFYDQPDTNPAGFISLFEFTMAIQAANSYTTQDLLDISYSDLLKGSSAKDQIAYIEAKQNETVEEPEYKHNLRIGLLHAAMMVLLPKRAFEEGETDWKTVLDCKQFRSEYDAAVNSFQKSGEVGESLVKQFLKIQRRIDQDNDGTMKDEEIRDFLSGKMKILEVY